MRSAILIPAVLAGFGACSDAAGPTANVRIVSGDRVTDTAATPLPNPLIVQVVSAAGRPAAGVEVRFLVFGEITFTPAGPRFHTRVSPLADTTDADGRASVRVWLGDYAGEDSVVVSVPTLDVETVARYTILPGAVAGVAVLPVDTVVYVDRGFRLRGSTIDRWGNARGEPVTYTASTEMAISGDSLTGRTIGRAKITATGGGHTGVGFVSVVPRGTVAALRGRVGTDPARLVVFDLDGSGLRTADLPFYANPQPDWAPAGGTLVMQDAGPFPGDNGHLVLVDSSGTRRRLIDSTAGFVAEYYPQYSVDGSWIYFAGAFPGRRAEIWRVHPDGSGLEQVGPQADSYDGDFNPSPSPDGTRLAFTRTPNCCYDLLVRVLDVSTGAIDTLQRPNGTPIAGLRPRWSPTGDVIAYLNAGQIWLMQPDASNERTGSPPGHAYGAFDWSPDGRWLIAESDAGTLYLIEPATGLTLPLAFTQLFQQPAWRP
ncbi:MAG: TolB family protein [Gemmatimonadota bacterium]